MKIYKPEYIAKKGRTISTDPGASYNQLAEACGKNEKIYLIVHVMYDIGPYDASKIHADKVMMRANTVASQADVNHFVREVDSGWLKFIKYVAFNPS